MLARIRSFLRTLRHRPQFDRHMDDEMRFHLDARAADLVRSGLSPEEAPRRARVEFGAVERTRELCREARGQRWVDEVRQDLRHAARQVCRSPGLATIAILSLALGIGANTALFSFVDTVLLKPLPYREPDRVVTIRESIVQLRHQYPSFGANAAHFGEWVREVHAFEQLALLAALSRNLTGIDEPEPVHGLHVTPNFFALLGVPFQHGRGFLADEGEPGRNAVVVIAHSLWKRRFGGQPGAVGGSVQLDGVAHRIVGVLPESFRLPPGQDLTGNLPLVARLEVFKPMEVPRESNWVGNYNYGALARLRRGASLAQAQAEINQVQAAITKRLPVRFDVEATVHPLQAYVVREARRGLWLLLAAVGVVLLMVCVNLANLLVARAAARTHESAIHAALGASRSRMVRRALTESLFLAALGGLAGVLLAVWGVGLLVQVAPPTLPRLDEVRLDVSVLGFSLVLSLATGLLCGVLPAWHAGRSSLQASLASANARTTTGVSGLRVREWLVGAEVALSALLLVTAGLLTLSFVRLMGTDHGFNAERVVALDLFLSGQRFPKEEQRTALARRLLDHVEAVPGVQAAAVVNVVPLEGDSWVDVVTREGDTRPVTERPTVNYRFISAGAFRALGIPLRQGRALTEADRPRRVAVLSEGLARSLWPGESPIGKRFYRGNPDKEPFEVIGVATDARLVDLRKRPGGVVYAPYWYRTMPSSSLVVRTAMAPAAAMSAIRQAVRATDPQVPVSRERTLEEVVARSLSQPRFQTGLVFSFAVMALLLACLGIFGVVSYTVARRIPEFGVRMALGATARDLYGLVLRQGMRPVLAGLVVGVGAALVLGRFLQGLLHEVAPADPGAITAALAPLLLVATLACWAPARRAARINPVTALRVE